MAVAALQNGQAAELQGSQEENHDDQVSARLQAALHCSISFTTSVKCAMGYTVLCWELLLAQSNKRSCNRISHENICGYI